jgi:hypothetical protein
MRCFTLKITLTRPLPEGEVKMRDGAKGLLPRAALHELIFLRFLRFFAANLQLCLCSDEDFRICRRYGG